jgi:RNA binding exosome subunit
MKKEELIAQLQAANTLSSTVDIDKMIALIKQITPEAQTGITQEIADQIASRIESCLDRNSDDLVNKDDASFSIDYGNTISIDDIQIDVHGAMDHITDILSEFVEEEDDVVVSSEFYPVDEETAE